MSDAVLNCTVEDTNVKDMPSGTGLDIQAASYMQPSEMK